MNQNELDIILNEGEGYRVEFKSKVDNSLAKEIVAFANSSGGRVFIGVNDYGKVINLDITNSLKSKVQDIINSCSPQVYTSISTIENILILEVFEGNDKPYECSSGFFLRSGPNSQKLKRDQIIEFLQAEGKVKFDELPQPKISFDDFFDKNLYNRFLRLSGISESLYYKDVLLNLRAIDIKGNQTIFTNTGLALFTKEYGSLQISSGITCVLYKGIERLDIIDRKEFTGDLISNIDDAIDFLKKNLKLTYSISDIQRKEDYEIPLVALRESVINAVVHRNYFEKGANTKLEIFDDRIEILNPGGLVKGLTEESFGTRSVLRNPTLADLMLRAKYIEKLGTGISRIRNVLEERDLPPPLFEFDDFFKIVFLRVSLLQLFSAINRDEIFKRLFEYFQAEFENYNKKRLSRFVAIVMSVTEIPVIQMKDLMDKISVSRPTLIADLNYLTELGILKSEGDHILRKYYLDSKGVSLLYKILH